MVDANNVWENVMSEELFHRLGFDEFYDLDPPTSPYAKKWRGERLVEGVKEPALRILGKLKVDVFLQLGDHEARMRTTPMVIEGLPCHFIFSERFFSTQHIHRVIGSGNLNIQRQEIPLIWTKNWKEVPNIPPEYPVVGIYVMEDRTIPACTIMAIPLIAPSLVLGVENDREEDAMINGDCQFMKQTDLHPWIHAMVRVDRKGNTHAMVFNSRDNDITVKKGTRYGTIHLAINIQHKDKYPRRIHILEREDRAAKEDNRMRWPTSCRIKTSKTIGLSPKWAYGENSRANVQKRMEYIRTKFQLQNKGKDAEMVGSLILQHWRILGVNQEEVDRVCTPNLHGKDKPFQVTDDMMKRTHEAVIQQNSTYKGLPWRYERVATTSWERGTIMWCTDHREQGNKHFIANVRSQLRIHHQPVLFTILPVRDLDLEEGQREAIQQRTRQTNRYLPTPWEDGLQGGSMERKHTHTYLRLCELAMEGLPHTLTQPFLKENVIFSVATSNHLASLDRYLCSVWRAGLLLDLSGRRFYQLCSDTTIMLEHQILPGKEGILPSPHRVAEMLKRKVQGKRPHIRSMLGDLSIYQRFIPQYAETVAPLVQALHHPDEGIRSVKALDKIAVNITFEMDLAYKTAVETLRDAIPLKFPRCDGQHPFQLEIMKSRPEHFHFCLTQQTTNGQGLIAYGSEDLTPKQVLYPKATQELMALLMSIDKWPRILRTQPSYIHFHPWKEDNDKTSDASETQRQQWVDELSVIPFCIGFAPPLS